jgi:anti-anti-sigma regulatory factor
MLMITETESTTSRRSLKLEGKLLGPWVDEFKRTCEQPETPPGNLSLDLSAVSFIDSAGIKVLGDLIQRGALAVGCSGFIAEMLNLNKS